MDRSGKGSSWSGVAGYARYQLLPWVAGVARGEYFADSDGFIEVAEAPNGFMCVKRDVFRRLMEGYPNLRYTPDGYANPRADETGSVLGELTTLLTREDVPDDVTQRGGEILYRYFT